MKRITLHSRTYTIKPREDSEWLDVVKDKVGVIAIVPESREARQCIYDDLTNNGFSCKFLNDDDFEEVS